MQLSCREKRSGIGRIYPSPKTMRDFVRGSTVIGFRYDKGMVVAADTRASYGRLAMHNSVGRIFNIGGTVVGFSGEVSDMQYLVKRLSLMTEEENRKIEPKGYHSIIQRILYSARSRLEPLNISVCVAGINTGVDGRHEKILGAVDMLGNFFFSDVICTGISAHIVMPFLREHVEDKEDTVTREEATKLAEEAMRLLVYRDCNAYNRIQVACVDGDGVLISEPYSIDTKWEIGLNEDEVLLE
jgi:20S proteasome subunit beta 7